MTVSGRVPLVLLGGLLPVLLWPGVGTVILFSCLVAAVCAVDLLLSTPINQFAVERQALLITRLGESCNSCISLTNLSKRRSDIEVRDAWPPSAGITATPVRLVLATAATSQIVTSLHPTKRGETVAGPVVLRSWGPLGLAARQRSISLASRLRVLPAFASHRHLPSRLARLRLFDGASSVNIRGQGTEFDSLRPYQTGDDVASIDWRATARSDKLMLRTWRPLRNRQVIIVLDCSRFSAGRVGNQTRLTSAIEATLLLGALATADGDRLEMIAYDRQLRARASLNAGANRLFELADALACLEPSLLEADWPGMVAEITRVRSQRALVVLLTSAQPALVAQGLGLVLPQLTARHQVIVGSVSQKPPDLAAVSGAVQAYQAAAQARSALEISASLAVLRERGALTLTASAQRLAPALADLYLELKATGRL